MSSTDASLLVVVLLLLIDWTIRVAAIIIIPRNRRPTAATAWLLAVFFIPYLGVLLFLLIGNPKLPRKRRAKQKEMDAFIRANTDIPEGRQRNAQWPAWFASVVELNSNLSAMPMVDGNSAHLIASYQ